MLPRQIGRFRIERILGQGGFGVVYLGHDEQLQRKVAIKVPKPQFVERAEDRELYLKEARTVSFGSDLGFEIHFLFLFDGPLITNRFA